MGNATSVSLMKDMDKITCLWCGATLYRDIENGLQFKGSSKYSGKFTCIPCLERKIMAGHRHGATKRRGMRTRLFHGSPPSGDIPVAHVTPSEEFKYDAEKEK